MLNAIIKFVLNIVLLTIASTCFSAVWYVQVGGTGTGTSWNQSFGSIQAAINAASSNDQIWIAEGTYHPTQNLTGTSTGPNDRTNTYVINKNIKLYGGFVGIESQISERNFFRHPTILSGDVGVIGSMVDNLYQILYVDGAAGITSACLIDGLIIRDGRATGNFPYDNGAGIFNSAQGVGKQASPTIQNCQFINNHSSAWGGALLNNGGNGGTSSPKMINCSFVDNQARYGGAMYNFGLDGTMLVQIINCTFFGNFATESGRVIRSFGDGQTTSISNSILWNGGDEITFAGTSSTVSLSHCIFDDGTADSVLLLPMYIIDLGDNQDLDPMFVDTTTRNVRIRNHSPAIDFGDNSINGLSHDLDFHPRLNGVIDIGAFENELVNCPDTIQLADRHLPLSGSYNAGEYLQINTDIHPCITNDVQLEAPTITIQPGSEVKLGGSLTLHPIGCVE